MNFVIQVRSVYLGKRHDNAQTSVFFNESIDNLLSFVDECLHRCFAEAIYSLMGYIRRDVYVNRRSHLLVAAF